MLGLSFWNFASYSCSCPWFALCISISACRLEEWEWRGMLQSMSITCEIYLISTTIKNFKGQTTKKWYYPWRIMVNSMLGLVLGPNSRMWRCVLCQIPTSSGSFGHLPRPILAVVLLREYGDIAFRVVQRSHNLVFSCARSARVVPLECLPMYSSIQRYFLKSRAFS